MFQLNADEYAALRSQFVTSNVGRGGRRYAPYAFTEQGVAMLSSVLNSPRAIAINIEIMRAFVQVRATLATHQDLAKQLAELQDKTESLAMSHETFSRNTRNQLKQVFDTLRELMTPPEPHKRPIGFVHSQDTPKPKPEPKSIKASKASAARKMARKRSRVRCCG
jgi:ORF6N domain